MSKVVSTNMRVITEKIRMSYVNLFTPKAMEEGQEPKYSLCVLIPKSDELTISKIEYAIETAKNGGFSLWGDGIPINLKIPLRDGDKERADQPEYRDHYFLNATSKQKPGIVDKNLKEILSNEEVYSGCYGRVSLIFYAFDQGGKKGIACGLQNVQKLAEGEPLGVRTSAEEDFAMAYEEDFLS